MTFNYAKLQGRIIEKFGTQKEFVRHIKMSAVSLSKKLQNKSLFNQDEIKEISSVLDIPIDEITSYFFDSETKKT